jgi:hypothetical protein
MTIGSEVQAAEKKVGVFLTAHHIVLYVLLALSITAGVYLFQSARADRAEAKAEAATTALAVEKDHSAQIASLFATAEAARVADRQQLDDAVSKIQSQTKVQIVHDQALPAPQLANRIDDLTSFKQGTTTLDASQNLVVPIPVAKAIVADLDQGQADSQTVVKRDQTIVSLNDTIAGQKDLIAEDAKVLAKQIDTDTKTLNAEKAKSRKSKIKWFFAGVVTGFVGRQLVKP